jgi:hypothetical protein
VLRGVGGILGGRYRGMRLVWVWTLVGSFVRDNGGYVDRFVMG